MFFHFAPVYVANHTVDKNFQVDDAVMAEFKKFLTSQSIEWTDADINGVQDWLKTRIKAEDLHHPVRPACRACACWPNWDPEIQKALTYLPEARPWKTTRTRLITEKADGAERRRTPAPTASDAAA